MERVPGNRFALVLQERRSFIAEDFFDFRAD
jgi:hypothetical protein